jgi:hypothetical protein
MNKSECGARIQGEVVLSQLGLHGGELGKAYIVPLLLSIQNLSETVFKGSKFCGMGAVGSVEGMEIGDLSLEMLNQIVGLLEQTLIGTILVALFFSMRFKFSNDTRAVFRRE